MSKFFKLTHSECSAINTGVIFVFEDDNNATINPWHEKLIAMEGFCGVMQENIVPAAMWGYDKEFGETCTVTRYFFDNPFINRDYMSLETFDHLYGQKKVRINPEPTLRAKAKRLAQLKEWDKE